MSFFRKPVKKQITQREIAAINNFHSLAYSGESVDIPAKRAKSRDLEHKEQMALIQYWRYEHKRYGVPECALLAIPNEGRGRNAVSGARLKAEGVRAGVSDLFLAVPRKGLPGAWIEMKSKEGRTSQSQSEFIAHMNTLGYATAVCYGAAEAIAFITLYLGEPCQTKSLTATSS